MMQSTYNIKMLHHGVSICGMRTNIAILLFCYAKHCLLYKTLVTDQIIEKDKNLKKM
jgi:hypothetical protein